MEKTRGSAPSIPRSSTDALDGLLSRLSPTNRWIKGSIGWKYLQGIIFGFMDSSRNLYPQKFWKMKSILKELLLMEEIRLTTWDVNNPVTSNWINYTNLNWLYIAGVLVAIKAARTFPKTPKGTSHRHREVSTTFLRNPGTPSNGDLYLLLLPVVDPDFHRVLRVHPESTRTSEFQKDWLKETLKLKSGTNLVNTLLETNIFAPENGWSWNTIVSFVSFTEGKYLHVFQEYKLISSIKSAPLVDTNQNVPFFHWKTSPWFFAAMLLVFCCDATFSQAPQVYNNLRHHQVVLSRKVT